MRLMKLELKRVLKTRLTLILLTFSLVLSLVMAYIPTSYLKNTTQISIKNQVRKKNIKRF